MRVHEHVDIDSIYTTDLTQAEKVYRRNPPAHERRPLLIRKLFEAAGLTDEGGKLPDVLSVGIDLEDITDAFESAGVQQVTDAVGEEDCPDVENSQLMQLYDDVLGCGQGSSDNDAGFVNDDDEDLPESYAKLV